MHLFAPASRARAVVACVLALAATACLQLVGSRSAEARGSQFTMFEAARELRSHDAELRKRTLEEIRAFGVRRIRVVMYWRDVAPQPDSRRRPANFDARDPGAYDWTTYERIVAEARARGIRVMLTPSGPVPRWATLTGGSVRYPSPSRFRRFMEAAGRQFGSRVGMWSIWNEPNHPEFLGPQYRRGRAYSPRLYRKLFWAAHRALRRTGNRRDRLIMGETAPRGNRNVVHPLRFVRGALCLNRRYRKKRGCHKLPADGYAHHPYTTRSGPFFVSRRRDDVTIGSLGRLTRALNRAGRSRAVRKRMPIYLTEFGIQSRPDPRYGVSQTRQAEYRAIAERMAFTNSRVRGFSQYLMRDDHPRSGDDRYGGFESGLRNWRGRKKIAYRGFRLPMIARRAGRRVRLWGLVRPHEGTERVRIQYRNRRGKWRRLKSDRTGRRGYWKTWTRYRRGRSYRVFWRSPDGKSYAGARTRVIRWRR
jgi:hypothetical protein